MNNPLRWIALVVLLAQVGCARWHGPVPDGLRPVDAAIPRVPPDGPGAPPSDGGGAVAVDVVVADCAATVMEPVCAGVCGNGIVDWCTTACTPCSGGGPDAGMGRCCSTSSEACDGTAPRGQTCLSLGYSGGRLSCGATCRLDTSSCDGCGHDARIASCGRADVDLVKLAKEVEDEFKSLNEEIHIAVMGCEVNGPGEARVADIGVAGGRGIGLIFKQGEVIRKVAESEIRTAMREEVDKFLAERKAAQPAGAGA